MHNVSNTVLFSLKVSDMLLSFHSPLNLCTPLTGESTGGVSSISACIIGESNSSYSACVVSNCGAIDTRRNGETSEYSTLHIVSSRASETSIAGIDRMMMRREDELSSSESFIYQRGSIFEKMEKKIQGTYIFYFY